MRFSSLLPGVSIGVSITRTAAVELMYGAIYLKAQSHIMV